jgi:predicted nuclease of predicted toxin-antitoxin system
MKLLFDANLPPQLAARLSDLFPASFHVRSGGLHHASDTEIWNDARKEDFTIITKDADFYDYHKEILRFENDSENSFLLLL